MTGPPGPDTNRGACQGAPNSKSHLYTADIAETAADRQARTLRRLFSFCQATACTIASLAFAVTR